MHHYSHSEYLASRLVDSGIKVIAGIQDLRALPTSTANHLRKHPQKKYAAMVENNPDKNDLEKAITMGWKGVPSIIKSYANKFDGWVTDPCVMVMRFEDFIGPQGGQSQLRQAHLQ